MPRITLAVLLLSLTTSCTTPTTPYYSQFVICTPRGGCPRGILAFDPNDPTKPVRTFYDGEKTLWSQERLARYVWVACNETECSEPMRWDAVVARGR